jgi:PAS domain S-box-containing protein
MTDSPRQDPAGWSELSLRAKSVALLSVPLAVLMAVLFSVYRVDGDVRRADESALHANDARAELVTLRSLLLDAETSLNAYIATGQARFLNDFDQARKAVAGVQSRLSAETGREPIQRLAGVELELLDRLRGGDAGLIERERKAMADLQDRIALLGGQEERTYSEERSRRDRARGRLIRTVILCGVLGPLAALWIQLKLVGRMVRRLRAVEGNAHRLAHGLPLNPLPAGTDEIADLGQQIENAAYLLREREAKLRESERRYRDFFDHAPIPYEEADREGVIRRFNQAKCRLVRCTPDQLLGRYIWDFVAPYQQEAFRAAAMRRMERGEECEPFECEYLLDDGSRITVEIHENLIRNDAGEVTGTVRSLVDVTQRNLAAVAARKVEQYAMELRIRNEQLAQALEGARSATVAKSRFLASVSHELRTPLNGIIGFSELLYDGKLGPLAADQHEVAGDILASGRHLLQLINDVLDLSKVEAGRMEFSPERHRLLDLVLEVRDVVRPLAERKLLAMEVDVPDDLIARIDGGRFKQVLYNYLSNAVKFTPQGGSIAVRISRESGARFRLEVEDTGIGVAEEELPRLFQEFSQLPNSRRAEQGTGLGLALTRHLVEAQGGSVGVRSIAGKGSVFFTTLPLESPAIPTTS